VREHRGVMTASLASLESEFPTLNRRLAVFDRDIRRRLGVWTHEEAVPVEDIISRFTTHGAFTDDGRVLIPLHEPESGDPTGEYVVYLGDHVVPCVVYYDYAKGDLARIPLEEFGRTYPARRIRFWHPDYGADDGSSGAGTGATAGTGAPASPSAAVGARNAADADAGGSAADVGADEDPPADESVPVDESVRADEDAPTDEGVPAAVSVAEEDLVAGDDVVAELRGFLNREREADREETRRRFRAARQGTLPEVDGGIPELVTAGIDVDDYGQQVVRLRVPTDDVDGPVDVPEEYGVYPGSEVLVDVVGDEEGFPVEAEVLEIEGRQLGLGVYWDRVETSPPESAFELDGNDRRFFLAELLNPVPYDREQDAIETLASDDRKRGLLTGETTLGFEQSLDVPVREHRLNKFQYRAAMNALRAEDVYCIHGPPGTGKTRTLVEVIRAAAAEGHRVLACAHSNQAVDNLLVGDSTPEKADRSSLHAFAQDGEFTVARAGSNTTSDLVDDEYANGDLYQSDVVCTTANAAHRFGENIFDYAVVDEASQATIPATLVPVTRAKRTILAGDHRQLPPYYSQERDDDERMEISLFEHVLDVYGDDAVTTLQTQYRMNEAIAAFPNRRFYGGALSHGSTNRDWTIGGLPPLSACDVSGEERQTPSQSYYNEREVEVVVDEVLDLLAAGIPPEAIGIIAPYSGQIGKIRAALGDSLAADNHRPIDVATVDSFQGSEREVVIISFVRSNAEGRSGFLTFPREGPRRLNVAMTRAKKRCVLVGDFDTVGTCAPGRDPGSSAADCYAALADFLRERGVVTSLD